MINISEFYNIFAYDNIILLYFDTFVTYFVILMFLYISNYILYVKTIWANPVDIYIQVYVYYYSYIVHFCSLDSWYYDGERQSR